MELLKLSVIPVMSLGVILTVFAYYAIYNGMTREVELSLAGIARTLPNTYRLTYDGDFQVENGMLSVGNVTLENNIRLIDVIKEENHVDATIYCGIRRATTSLVDTSGNRLVGTMAIPEVSERVIKDGEEYFSSNTPVNNTAYFAYYIPIYNEKSEIIGMSVAGKPRSEVIHVVRMYAFNVIAICTMATMIVIFFAYKASGNMLSVITGIMTFLQNIDNGYMDRDMDEIVLKRNDELGQIGECAVRLRKDLVSMISNDPLTGLLNRRAGISILKEWREQYEGNDKKVFSICIADIDFFKAINDSYGHNCGDKILAELSTLLYPDTEKECFVSRWGGEEFLIGCRVSQDLMQQYIKRIQEKIRNHKFFYEKEVITLSLTFGITEYQLDKDMDENIRRGDMLLYWGKENGRDQIVN